MCVVFSRLLFVNWEIWDSLELNVTVFLPFQCCFSDYIFCLVITVQQQAIQQLTKAIKRLLTTCTTQLMWGVQPQDQMWPLELVAVVNPIQDPPQRDAESDSNDDSVLAPLEEEDEDVQVL